MTPQRIQLSRKKGWRLPPNTVVVSRPSKWGNPFTVDRWDFPIPDCPLWACVARDSHSVVQRFDRREDAVAKAVEMYREMMVLRGQHGQRWLDFLWKYRIREESVTTSISYLRGKNLACWCKLGEPCHADVLLELANKAELQSLIESLTERCHQQSELLSRRAEVDPLRAAATEVHEAIRRMTTYEPATLTLAGCRDRLAAVLGIKTEAKDA